MKLWNWKFTLSVLVVAVFLLDSFWRAPDPVTHHARHLLEREGKAYLDTGIASFAFLLSLLYVLSHGWQRLMARLRGRPLEPEEPQEKKRRKKRRR